MQAILMNCLSYYELSPDDAEDMDIDRLPFKVVQEKLKSMYANLCKVTMAEEAVQMPSPTASDAHAHGRHRRESRRQSRGSRILDGLQLPGTPRAADPSKRPSVAPSPSLLALAKAFASGDHTGINPAKLERMEEVLLRGADLDFQAFCGAFLGSMASKYPKLVN